MPGQNSNPIYNTYWITVRAAELYSDIYKGISMPISWGSPDHYYASQRPRQEELSLRERLIGEKLEKFFPNLKERVERAFRQSNLLVREHVRSETRLRLSNDEKFQAVPVRVVAGVPFILHQALDMDPDVLDLYLQHSLLRKTVLGLEKVLEKHSFLENWPPMAGMLPSVPEIRATHNGIGKLCDELKKIKFFDQIWKIEEDIFGAYFFRQCRIELYWMAIGLGAAELGCSPESLTQVVAIHELAHAYTHIGFDIDDCAWDTDYFARSSLAVVEGLAQYFTRAVCERLEGRYPETLKAYDLLLAQQRGPYKAHLDWVAENEAGGEVVRNAMILFRSHRQTNYDVFMQMLKEQKQIIGKRSKKIEKQNSATEAHW
jgi:tetratricopeptide (TPR) repeat protein